MSVAISVNREGRQEFGIVKQQMSPFALRKSAPSRERKATGSTNTLKRANSTIRKFTRNRKQYPSRDSALKLIFLAIREASKTWTMPIPNWKDARYHFAILFEDRMANHLN